MPCHLVTTNCQEGLHELPDSLDLVCFTPLNYKRSFDVAKTKCAEWNFDGLFEIRTQRDWEEVNHIYRGENARKKLQLCLKSVLVLILVC